MFIYTFGVVNQFFNFILWFCWDPGDWTRWPNAVATATAAYLTCANLWKFIPWFCHQTTSAQVMLDVPRAADSVYRNQRLEFNWSGVGCVVGVTELVPYQGSSWACGCRPHCFESLTLNKNLGSMLDSHFIWALIGQMDQRVQDLLLVIDVSVVVWCCLLLFFIQIFTNAFRHWNLKLWYFLSMPKFVGQRFRIAYQRWHPTVWFGSFSGFLLFNCFWFFVAGGHFNNHYGLIWSARCIGFNLLFYNLTALLHPYVF